MRCCPAALRPLLCGRTCKRSRTGKERWKSESSVFIRQRKNNLLGAHGVVVSSRDCTRTHPTAIQDSITEPRYTERFWAVQVCSWARCHVAGRYKCALEPGVMFLLTTLFPNPIEDSWRESNSWRSRLMKAPPTTKRMSRVSTCVMVCIQYTHVSRIKV